MIPTTFAPDPLMDVPPLAPVATTSINTRQSPYFAPQPQPPHRDPFEVRPLGIINQANDCFLIALFQCLVMHDVYRSWLVRYLPKEEYQPWLRAFAKYRGTLTNFATKRASEDRETDAGDMTEYEPQEFNYLAKRMLDTSLLRACFLSITNDKSTFSEQRSQQDSQEALVKLLHYVPETKALSVVRTRYLRPTRRVYDEEQADATKRSVVSKHNTIVACQGDWDLQFDLAGKNDTDVLHIEPMLDRLAYDVLPRDMQYEVKLNDPANCVREYRVMADTYEWNNKEPPLACTIYLKRSGMDAQGRFVKILASVEMPEVLDLASRFWNPRANGGRTSDINAKKKHPIVGEHEKKTADGDNHNMTDATAAPLIDLDKTTTDEENESEEEKEEGDEYAARSANNNKQVDYTYCLQSFVQHKGNGSGNGHYVAYVQSQPGLWFRCDDMDIANISAANVARERKQSYLYFYRREIVTPISN